MPEREPFAVVELESEDIGWLVKVAGETICSGDGFWEKSDAEQMAARINAAVEARVKDEVSKAVEEFRKRAAHKAASMCGVNPSTRRPCFEKESNKRFWCPICTNADEILALPTEPEGK